MTTYEELICIITNRIIFLDKLQEEYYQRGDYKECNRLQAKVEELNLLLYNEESKK